MKFPLSLILPLLFIISCQSSERPSSKDSDYNLIPLEYARSFAVLEKEGSYKLQSFHPNHPNTVVQEIIVGKKDELESSLLSFSDEIESVAVLSTTYLEFIRVLDESESIRCVSNADLIFNAGLRAKIESKSIVDLGNDDTFNIERLIESDVDLAFYYDFGPGTASMVKRLQEMGIKVVLISEFLEKDPLGKAEWIKFFGVLFGKLDKANELFQVIKEEYEDLKMSARTGYEKKTVFTGLPWKGEWHQPGGASFQASYFNDAGADYLWKEDSSVSGMLMDREIIFDRAFDADVWLHPNNALDMDEISSVDNGFEKFKSFRSGDIYNNNKRLNDNMGNDYWESGLLNPHIILKDLISIFQPSLLPEHELVYYRKLE